MTNMTFNIVRTDIQ